MMSILASRHLWQDALAVLRDAELESTQVGPALPAPPLDAAVYNAVITTCARASRWQWSLFLLAYLREAGSDTPVPNVISFNAAIHACERRGLWEQGLLLLESLSEVARVQSSSLNCAISACEKGQQWQAALFLLSRFGAYGCQRSLLTYGAASAACAVSQCWETALELLADMRQMVIKPSREMVNCLVEVCRRSWAWQQGLDLVAQSCKGLGSFRQRAALLQALEASQVYVECLRKPKGIPTASVVMRTTSPLELRQAALSNEHFVWQNSRPAIVASAEWLSLASVLATDCIRQSLEQQNGFGSRWRTKPPNDRDSLQSSSVSIVYANRRGKRKLSLSCAGWTYLMPSNVG